MGLSSVPEYPRDYRAQAINRLSLWTFEDAMALGSALQNTREQKVAGARPAYVTGLLVWAKC